MLAFEMASSLDRNAFLGADSGWSEARGKGVLCGKSSFI